MPVIISLVQLMNKYIHYTITRQTRFFITETVRHCLNHTRHKRLLLLFINENAFSVFKNFPNVFYDENVVIEKDIENIAQNYFT